MVIDAVTGLGARVLMTTGHGFDASRLRDVPGNVRVAARLGQADVLAEAALVVATAGPAQPTVDRWGEFLPKPR